LDTTLDASQLAQHRKFLFNFALRAVADRAQAEDLVQDTFVAALTSGAAFRGDSALRTWLTGILKHKILDAWRARSRAMDSLDTGEIAGEEGASALDAIPAPNADPAQHLEQKRLWERFSLLLGRMPRRTAESFLRVELGGESTEEVCGTLAVSPGRLAVMRHRARSLLRDGMMPLAAA